MAAEVFELRVEFGVKTVGLEHSGLAVVDDGGAGHAPKVLKGVLQALDEVVR